MFRPTWEAHFWRPTASLMSRRWEERTRAGNVWSGRWVEGATWAPDSSNVLLTGGGFPALTVSPAAVALALLFQYTSVSTSPWLPADFRDAHFLPFVTTSAPLYSPLNLASALSSVDFGALSIMEHCTLIMDFFSCTLQIIHQVPSVGRAHSLLNIVQQSFLPLQ